MEVEVKVLKDIPKEQIKRFQDKVVYNVAVFTREFTKNIRAYPYLSGELQRQEVALPIEGSNMEYSLGTGVDYAIKVYTYGNETKWTNPDTLPHWYHKAFEKGCYTIVRRAVETSLKEV